MYRGSVDLTNAAEEWTIEESGPVPHNRHRKEASEPHKELLRKSYVKPGSVRNRMGPDETC